MHLQDEAMTIEAIKPLTREALFTMLYESTFPKAAAFIRKMGGSFEEARDIFQDALVVYYEKKQTGTLVISSDDKAYLLGICRNLWYRQHQAGRLKQRLDPNDNAQVADITEPEVSAKLLQVVEQAGKKCLELLKAFYYDKLNMKELSDKFGFSGERSATAQKYKCLEKIRISIRNKSLDKTDFYD